MVEIGGGQVRLNDERLRELLRVDLPRVQRPDTPTPSPVSTPGKQGDVPLQPKSATKPPKSERKSRSKSSANQDPANSYPSPSPAAGDPKRCRRCWQVLCRDTEQEIEHLKSQNAQLMEEVARLKTVGKDLELDRQKARIELSEMAGKMARHVAAAEHHKSAEQSVRAEMGMERARWELRGGQIRSMQEELEGKDREANVLRKELATAAAAYARLKSELASWQPKHSRALREIEELKKSLATATSEAARPAPAPAATDIITAPPVAEVVGSPPTDLSPEQAQYVAKLQAEISRITVENKSLKATESLVATRNKVEEHKSKGNSAFNAGRMKEALEAYTRGLGVPGLRDDALVSVLHCNRAACFLGLGRFPEALMDAARSAALQPNYARARQRRVSALLAIGDYHKALEDLIALQKMGCREMNGKMTECRQNIQRPHQVDHYAVMGLSQSCTAAQVKQAYKQHALVCHPDKAPDQVREAAEQVFKYVQSAYAVLSDPDERRKYDQYVQCAAQASAAAQHAKHAYAAHPHSAYYPHAYNPYNQYQRAYDPYNADHEPPFY